MKSQIIKILSARVKTNDKQNIKTKKLQLSLLNIEKLNSFFTYVKASCTIPFMGMFFHFGKYFMVSHFFGILFMNALRFFFKMNDRPITTRLTKVQENLILRS